MKKWKVKYYPDEGLQDFLIIAEICYQLSQNTIYADKVVIIINGTIESIEISE